MTLTATSDPLVASPDREPAGASYPVCDTIQSIPSLIGLGDGVTCFTRFKANVEGLKGYDTRTLIVRLETTLNPLILWAIHQELDLREIPPALRWPACQISEQMVFVTWLADVYWFSKRNPKHRTLFPSWQALFKNPPGSDRWHGVAHGRYLFGSLRNGSAHYFARGLALTTTHRQELFSFQTNQMRAERRLLMTLEETRELVYSHAKQHPDKSRLKTPEEIVQRRLELWKLYILCGRNQNATVKYYMRISGKHITRQGLAKQLTLIGNLCDQGRQH